MRLKRLWHALLPALIVLFVASPALAAVSSTSGRIFLLIVWDGLRPDFVSERDTPNLFALAQEGVRFEHHHAVFPTVTMVNAAALATGGAPGATGILGDVMYLAPALKRDNDNKGSLPGLGALIRSPLNLEHSQYLGALNGPRAFNNHLVGVEAVAQQVRHAGGYVAIVGKQGPTLLFDSQLASPASSSSPDNYLFVADDMAAPLRARSALIAAPPMRAGDLASVGARDAWFGKVMTEQVLPTAEATAARGRPVLLVLWQHNPDFVEHAAGLGTQPALNALRESDDNLGRLRQTLTRLGIAGNTDIMVVSDHGFATIRMPVALADLLVTAGIKKAVDSSEIVIARNGGADLIYLSRSSFATEESRRAALARIVDFAEAQEWCGPIFSRAKATNASASRDQTHLGWIPGTFSQELVGIDSAERSPDLIVSFRELAEDNRHLTGPANPAFGLGLSGQRATPNHSYQLVRPIDGVVYSDTDSGGRFSAGMGMHGAAGERELHNFCAATGPDFRRHYLDRAPTGNRDVAATIRAVLHQEPVRRASGRVMQEALSDDVHGHPSPRQIKVVAYLVLPGAEIVTTLHFTRFDSLDYLDGAAVVHNPIGPAQ
jgi:type I phosphodiesterase/nucleotide pyrophosphatase